LPGRNRRLALVFLLFWSFLVLYPQPTALGESLYRLFVPPVQMEAVTPLIPGLPSGAAPAELEKHILNLFPYHHDWQIYGYPWYFPTTAEAMQKGRGDCKTRFIVLASLFEALEVPYELLISPTHIWISYAGKEETTLESMEAALFYRDGEETIFKLPRVDWLESAVITWEAFWVYMPPQRKAALVAGFVFSLLLFFQPSGKYPLLR
jgi:hypothetical protein